MFWHASARRVDLMKQMHRLGKGAEGDCATTRRIIAKIRTRKMLRRRDSHIPLLGRKVS